MQFSFSEIEKEILQYWKKNKIFEKSLKGKRGNFVFYEGPPTANAKPGVHHVLARIFKDVVCRYKTMQGFRVLRKAGWDTHGLPVELETEKKLGLKSKKEIEEYGIDRFNQKCKQSVFQYKKDWEDLTKKIGHWLDMENPFFTYDPFYMESVWWIIKKISDKGLLYQGYKVVPYCPRCGTGLSSHEVAQGYRKIREPAIYVKFKVKGQKSRVESYLLVWTTTPWTLPANVAIAVNPEIDYVLAKVGKPFTFAGTEKVKGKEYLIVAKERTDVLGEDFEIVEELKGKDLVGLSYENLFPEDIVSVDTSTENIYKVLAADFVTIEEGTGLVHIAPAFGEEDMELIKSQNLESKTQKEQFPILLTVDEEGKFKSEVKKWKGMFVKDADPLITDYLREQDLLFKEEEYEHDYPFCWRCETPLLYYAKMGWFIRTTKVKEELLKNNQDINWIPAHIKEGRFGEWLRELKDWSLSRERYWGTPLPVWQCGNCKNQIVIGSRKDLSEEKFSKNKYFLLRHGESLNITEDFHSSYPEKRKAPLTEKGKRQIEKIAQKLKKEKVDLIWSSDIERTRETAEIVSKVLNLDVQYDERLREVGAGEFNGKDRKDCSFYNAKEKKSLLLRIQKRFKEAMLGGETYGEVRSRILNFIREINKENQNKNILIVGHEGPFQFLDTATKGMTIKETAHFIEKNRFKLGELRELEFKDFPYNTEGELDLHRPYIDEIRFICPECGKLMERVPEVIDCWFDSGSMPFSQYHYPFENKKLIDKGEQFPAEYITEAIDQTRGWFYTLLAISTLLGFGSPYKNVVTLGHILDEKGQKMSKSKGNVVDPWEIVERYGADALRWYLYIVNQPWDSKLFSEKDVDQSLKKFVMTLWNCFMFWSTYHISSKFPARLRLDEVKAGGQVPSSKNLSDRWILSRMNALIHESTKRLDKYDITGAARLIEDFVINDLSLWYIRRSRKRFQQPENREILEEASNVLGFVLVETLKLAAPFIPFLTEKIYRELTRKESVHLEDWPKGQESLIDELLEKEMEVVREIVSIGLRLRSGSGIKVRQPLASLQIQILKLKIQEGLLELIKEELNVKEVELVDQVREEKGWVLEKQGEIELALDTNITNKLKEEGVLREVIRMIQDARKNIGCTPKDRIKISFIVSDYLKGILKNGQKQILSQTKTEKIGFLKEKPSIDFSIEREARIDDGTIWIGVRK